MSPSHATNVTAILLAAGDAARLGGDKLNLPYKGTTLFQRAVAPIVDCPLIHDLVVVIRPDAPSLVEDVKCKPVVNHHWHEGMGSSLRLGVATAAEDADALLVCLADMPEIGTDLLTAMIEAFAHCGRTILVPWCEGRSGHPVLFDAAWRGPLGRLGGDIGAKHLLRQSPNAVAHFETTDRAVLFDVDRPEDISLRRIRTRNAAHASALFAALKRGNIFHTKLAPDEGDGDVGPTATIAYHVFDEARVAEIRASLEGDDA